MDMKWGILAAIIIWAMLYGVWRATAAMGRIG